MIARKKVYQIIHGDEESFARKLQEAEEKGSWLSGFTALGSSYFVALLYHYEDTEDGEKKK